MPIIAPLKVDPPALIKPPAPQPTARILFNRSLPVSTEHIPDNQTLARELENLLQLFRYPPQHLSAVERANLLRADLIGLLGELDRRGYVPADDVSGLNTVLRQICFDWADTLLDELRVEQPAHERGACLESLAAILENTVLSEKSLDAAHKKRFTGLMVACMGFVMNKLGAKGVFHNTLLFSGRFLVSCSSH